MIKPGQIYRHYKGKEYKIICLGKLESILEDAEFGKHAIWIRPQASCEETVGSTDGSKMIQHFTLVDKSV